jgi:hypothetical protein
MIFEKEVVEVTSLLKRRYETMPFKEDNPLEGISLGEIDR